MLFTCLAQAQTPSEQVYVPDSLKPWVEWVKQRNPDRVCHSVKSQMVCDWPGRISLAVGQTSGIFEQVGYLERPGEIEILGGVCGSSSVWPLDVENTSKSVPVLSRGNKAFVRLPSGPYSLKGHFGWSAIPQEIKVPSNIGRVVVSMGEGLLYLRPDGRECVSLAGQSAQDSRSEADSLSYEVYRKLDDGIPFEIQTYISLKVSGLPRKVEFENLAPFSSVVTSISSDLAWQFGENDALLVQVQPGRHYIRVASTIAAPPQELPYSPIRGEGGPDEETWVFQADRDLRSVEISGASPVQAERTSLPPEWRSFPAYVLSQGVKLALKETNRGESVLPADSVHLEKSLWLNEDGQGFSVQDKLMGALYQTTRLDVDPGVALNRVSINGVDALITSGGEDNATGIEIRDRQISLIAESRVERVNSDFLAVGWRKDVASLSTTLHLPPGWVLFAAQGVDEVSRSWISRWTLYDIFVVCLVAMFSARLLGFRFGVIALAGLILAHGEMGAPFSIWFVLLALLAICRVLPEGGLKKYLQGFYAFCLLSLLLILIPFCIDQIRVGLFPQLGEVQGVMATESIAMFEWTKDLILGLILGPIGAIGLIVLVLISIWGLIKRRWKMVFGCVGIIMGALLLCGSLSLMASSKRYAYVMEQRTEELSDQLQSMPIERAAIQDRENAPPIPARVLSLGKSKFDSVAHLKKADPNSLPQAGYGLPNWSWSDVTLGWKGPVQADHLIHLYFIGPVGWFLLSILRILLLIVLAVPFFKYFKPWLAGGKMASLMGCGILFALLAGIFSPNAQAQSFPDQHMLDELDKRIESTRCHSDCASTSQVILRITGEDSKTEVLFDAKVQVRDGGAWAIPGPLDQFMPTSIKVDGLDSYVTRSDSNGVLWLRLPGGIHRVEVEGSLVKPDVASIQFELPPGHLDVAAPGWSIDGVSSTGTVQGSLRLMREVRAKPKEDEAFEEREIPSWFVVTRVLNLGPEWEIKGQVARQGGMLRAEAVKIPIFDKETITTPGIKVGGEGGKDRYAELRFKAGEKIVNWESKLAFSPSVQFLERKQSDLSEHWTIACSEIWQCRAEGITPVSHNQNGIYVLDYSPWPGESVNLYVDKPLSVPGDRVAITKVSSEFRPGESLLDVVVNFQARSASQAWETVTLPPAADVTEIMANGVKQSIVKEGDKIKVQLMAGEGEYRLAFRIPWTGGFYSKMPSISFSRPLMNYSAVVSIPEDRWLLWTGGIKWGPVVLFWSKLVMVLLVGAILGWFSVGAMGVGSWMLLGIGLATQPVILMLIPVLWLLAIHYKAKNKIASTLRYNFYQVLYVGLTLCGIWVLYETVHAGLILYPDMQIAGNDSTGSSLRWYQDIVSGETPSVFILSFPVMVWRGFMLLWSCWLVWALMGWAKGVWRIFVDGGLWKKPTTAQNAQ